MAIVKGSGSTRKIKIALQPVSGRGPTQDVIHGAQSELPIIHPESDANLTETDPNPKKKTIGMLKSMHPAPQPLPVEPEPALEIPSELQQALARYESQMRHSADAAILAYKDAQKVAIDSEVAAYKAQQYATLQSEMSALRDQGYKDGYAQGEAKGLAEYSSQLQGFFDAINDVSQNKRLFLENSEPELLKLAVKIAEKIIHNQIEMDQNTLMSIVDHAIRRITDKDKVIIKTSPSDADYIRQRRDDILEKMPDIRSLEVHEDPKIERGGCIIETRLGFIDSLISTKLASIEAALFKVYNDR